jgi:hypothetical protein
MTSKYLILFNAYFKKNNILKFLIWHKKSKKMSQFHNVTYNYQMSKWHWNFETLLNLHRPSWHYDISKNFLTSPFEHTVLLFYLCNWNVFDLIAAWNSLLLHEFKQKQFRWYILFWWKKHFTLFPWWPSCM